MNLPMAFLEKMKAMLKEEYDAFVKSYEEDRSQGLRVNTLKISKEEFLKINPFTLMPIPWTEEGFYYNNEERPGKHPYHEAGLYYIQEPSAMAVGELLDPKPGERVLDLCAAPGGKTTHIAAKMKGRGFLLTNEIHPVRSKILSQNVERMGIKNTVVTNETPERLADRFESFFDRILVDAPCSGEGMFRKDPDACREWSIGSVGVCAVRQNSILKCADKMLRPGGRIVYSTCTFSPEENEETISRFLKQNPYFEIEDIKVYEGFEKGREDWSKESNIDLSKTIRIWPHKVQGEGHYIAVLRKRDGQDEKQVKFTKYSADKKLLKEYFRFSEENLNVVPEGKFVLFGEHLYIVPDEMIELQNLKVLRPGWHLGAIKKNRFEPSHALALALQENEVQRKLNLGTDSLELFNYLKGEVLEAPGEKGWYLIQAGAYSIGWGKLTNQIMKNHYPKGLRWTGTR